LRLRSEKRRLRNVSARIEIGLSRKLRIGKEKLKEPPKKHY